ncbi:MULTISPECIES: EAL domain-containing protein [Vibrio]|nr:MULTISPECIES: EAL domain-containing protein [Vibrio]MBF9002844.1 EAL domain-containing protein [Vibrio nitrifigilis]
MTTESFSLRRTRSLLNLATLNTHLILFFTSFAVYLYMGIAFSNTYFNQIGEHAIQYVDQILENTRKQTSYILDQYPKLPCSTTRETLRVATFHSDYAKDIALFNPKGQIFCTNAASDDKFHLYQDILTRLDQSPKNETLSYTQAALTRQYSIFFIFRNSTKYGLSISIPPRYFTRDLSNRLHDTDIYFQVLVNGRTIKPIKSEAMPLRHMAFHSKQHPLEIHFALTFYTYLNYLFKYSWIFVVLYLMVLLNHLQSKKKQIEESSLEHSVVGAIKKRELYVHFQPIIDAKTEKVSGCEALIRWNHPTQGNIPPSIFIPLAQRMGHIRELTDFVLETCMDMYQRNQSIMLGRYISINIDRELLLTPDFTEDVATLCKEYPCFHRAFAFEITENGDFTDDELVVVERNVDTFHKLGIRLFVDDFGTGYSGLNFVRQFQFHTMKIDKVFIKNLGHEPYLTMLLESMLTISDSLNMKSIIEGVETLEQLTILKQMGVSYIQGFYFSKPLPETDLIEYIQRQ